MPKVTKDHKRKRKAEIAEAARKIFIQKGFEQTTMTDVVNFTGFSRGSVYQYFSSTDEMFRFLTDQSDSGFENTIQTLLQKHGSAWNAIDEYLAAIQENFIDNELGFGIVQFEYFINSARKEERANYLLTRYNSAVKSFSDLIHHGIQNGEFKPIQPVEAIVLFFINVTDGLLMQRLLTINILPPSKVYVSEQLEGLKIYLKQVLQFHKE
ncbi:TetR family transcriptional regulator [Falsibacillus albus]|uniref:TetR family transcriptional regulator n=1 Tax=Falsibacillus albus TaxID=2478915 RepID=UPI0013146175|nr:TetR family transcriptional regulator [Falsibacillus albus]